MNKLISIENLNYTIPYGADILKNISFSVSEGEFLGVLGRNGVGKTTLIDIILGIRACTSGSIKILGEDPMNADRAHLSSICFLSQDSVLKGSLTVEQYLKFYASLYPTYSVEQEGKLLRYFSLEKKIQIGALSTGQKKKVQAVGALSTFPKLILIDEITAVLDPETRDQLFKILLHLKEQNGLSIVLATNIAEDLINRADRVLFIDKGEAAVHAPSEIFKLFQVEKIA